MAYYHSAGEQLSSALAPDSCLKKGLCSVKSRLGQESSSHNIYFEIHGLPKSSTTDVLDLHRIIFIMGLNTTCFTWSPQVKHFSRMQHYEVLVFDNRGVGHSGYPSGLYSTINMAQDVIQLLDHVGWTEEHGVNVVGMSLGGMIAQELAIRIPDRIRSLLLAVSTPGGSLLDNLPPLKGLISLTKLMLITDPAKRVPVIVSMVFPELWLNAVAENDPQRRTNRAIQLEAFSSWAALEKPQQFVGHLSQMIAGLYHAVSKERLEELGQAIPKVAIVTGDNDILVRPQNSLRLRDAMGKENVEYVEWPSTGHAVHAQDETRFNRLIMRVCAEALSKVRPSRAL